MAFKYTVRKDGRLMKRVSINGKLTTLYSDNPKDLEKQYIEKKSQEHKGIFVDDDGLTISIWSNRWFETYKADKEQATKNMYSDAIKLYIIPELGNFKLKSLKENDITSMLNKLNNKPRQKEIVLLTIKQILDRAVDNDLIYKNVANKVKIKKHKAVEKAPLTELEISYLNKISEKDSRCFMLLFMLYTGLRKEEVAPLTYKDIDINNKTLTISKAVHWENNHPSVKQTKNEYIRKVPILDIIFDNVQRLKNSHKDNELMFPMATSNKIMTETSIRKLLKHTLTEINKLYKKDQIDTLKSVSANEDDIHEEDIKTIRFTYHQLRHTYACMLHKARNPCKRSAILNRSQKLKYFIEYLYSFR